MSTSPLCVSVIVLPFCGQLWVSNSYQRATALPFPLLMPWPARIVLSRNSTLMMRPSRQSRTLPDRSGAPGGPENDGTVTVVEVSDGLVCGCRIAWILIDVPLARLTKSGLRLGVWCSATCTDPEPVS